MVHKWEDVRQAVANSIQGETFKDSKQRLSKRTGIKGKQFDKIKFALVQRHNYSKPVYLTDGMSKVGSLHTV